MFSFSDKLDEDKEMYLSTGNTLRFKKDPRFGRWALRLEAGQLPQALLGSFMTFQDALRTARGTYMARGVSIHTEKQSKYSDTVNEVRVEMGLEAK